MSDLPLQRTQKAKLFKYITLDIFGLFEVKDAVKKWANKKVWPLFTVILPQELSMQISLTYFQKASSNRTPLLWRSGGIQGNYCPIEEQTLLVPSQHCINCTNTLITLYLSYIKDIAVKKGTGSGSSNQGIPPLKQSS